MFSKFDFLLGAARPFGFLVGEGLFFLIDETSFFRQSESIYFCNQLPLGPIRKFNLIFNK